MPKLHITLSNAKMQQLHTMAERLGVPVEELARAQVESLLAPPDEDFLRVAEYVLKKNEELYRRLAASGE